MFKKFFLLKGIDELCTGAGFFSYSNPEQKDRTSNSLCVFLDKHQLGAE